MRRGGPADKQDQSEAAFPPHRQGSAWTHWHGLQLVCNAGLTLASISQASKLVSIMKSNPSRSK